MNKFRLILLSFFIIGSAMAQDLSKLTPDQMAMYKKYMAEKNGTTATIAAPVVEKEKVTTRKIENVDSILVVPDKIKKDKDTIPTLKVYGSYLFNKEKLTFEPNLNIPTPQNYVLGTLDEVVIDISGLYEANYKLKVSPEGVIRVPNVGPIKVAGQTIAGATRAIKNQISSVFTGISSGETNVNVTLGNIRSIRVSVVGDAVRPGSYTLPSLATAFNALYACGGPTETGTMRDIKVVRAGKVIANIDVYKFLNEGVLLNNVVLQDEDVLRIDPYEIRTKITGSVKREGIYEGKKSESLQSLLQYAGGFSDNAYKGKVTVFRYSQKLKSVVDVEQSQYSTFKVTTGDSLFISKTVDQYANKIDLVGSVYQPGSYAMEPGLTVKQLLAKAGGVKDDAYMKHALIKRKQENQIPENLGFNLEELLNDKLTDILLQKDDTVEIKSLFDYREKKEVSILGPVQKPGLIEISENTTVKDVIFMAGGFKENSTKDTVELVRMIKDPDILRSSGEKSTIRKIAFDKDFNMLNGADSIMLQNGDQIIVRTVSGYEEVRMVRLEGEVIHPGSYNIRNKGERISDLLMRSGGVTQYAYKEGAFLIRAERLNEIEQKLNKTMVENTKNQLEDKETKSIDANVLKASGANSLEGFNRMDSIQRKLSGSKVVEKIFESEGVVGLNMIEILKKPGSKYDLKLEDNDIIYIPRELQTVRVIGQVLFPTLVRFDANMRLKDFINNSGGFSNNANRKRVFVLYPNGYVKSTTNFLGLKFYPKIAPGSRIVVPEKPVDIKNKLTTAEQVAILTSISSSIALIYSIIVNE